MQIFLAPRSNEASYKNFLSTIENGVEYDFVAPYLDMRGKKLLSGEEKLYVWGNKESKKASWDKIKPNDWVLFYRKGEFVYAGRILYKQQSRELGLRLWPAKKKQEPWTYVFFLKDLTPIQLPFSVIKKIGEYHERFVVVGFTTLNSKATDALQKDYSDFQSFVKAFEANEVPSARNNNIKQQEGSKQTRGGGTRAGSREAVQEVQEVHIELDDSYRHYLRAPDKEKVRDLLERTEKKRLVLPAFQRYFDWKKNDVASFLESIFNGYYIGSLLFWDVDRHKDPPIGMMPVQGVFGEIASPEEIVLDGQQRITALYYAIKAPNFKLSGSATRLYFYINLKAVLDTSDGAEVIEIKKNKLSMDESVKGRIFPFYELPNLGIWMRKFEDKLEAEFSDRERVKDIRDYLNGRLTYFWEGYEVPFVVLPSSMSLPSVAEIFERINTRGKRLDTFDLLIARLYGEKIDLRELWDRTLEKFPLIKKYDDADIKIGLYIFSAIALAYEQNSSTKRKDILNIYDRVYRSSEHKFEDHWKELSSYMEQALERIEGFRNGYGVISSQFLPYAPMLPVLAALLKLRSSSPNEAEVNNKIDSWYWASVFTGAYEASADTRMTADYRAMKSWLARPKEEPRALVEIIKLIDGFNFNLHDVTSTSSGMYRGVLALIALEGGVDLATEQKLENSGDYNKDHIFPRAFYQKKKYVDSVLNITWMSKETNQKIKGSKKPSVFLADMLKDQYNQDGARLRRVLHTHFITDEAYVALKKDEFEKFLTLRKKEIIRKLASLLGLEIDGKSSKMLRPETPFSNKLYLKNIIGSGSGEVLWADKYFTKSGLETIFEGIRRSGAINKVQILTSLDKADDQLRRAFKDFKKEVKNLKVDAELRVIVDKKLKSQIHDRWLIVGHQSYNIPSPDIIKRGQYSEIISSDESIPFKDWWDRALDIVSDWEKIQKSHLK